MHDPIGIHQAHTPGPTRTAMIAPNQQIADLYKRMTGNFSDPVETHVFLLTHLVFLCYTDLKEQIFDERTSQ